MSYFLLGIKFVKLEILPTSFIYFLYDKLGELMSRSLGLERSFHCPHKIHIFQCSIVLLQERNVWTMSCLNWTFVVVFWNWKVGAYRWDFVVRWKCLKLKYSNLTTATSGASWVPSISAREVITNDSCQAAGSNNRRCVLRSWSVKGTQVSVWTSQGTGWEGMCM